MTVPRRLVYPFAVVLVGWFRFTAFFRELLAAPYQCPAVLEGHTIGLYCQLQENHDGPHVHGELLFFRWTDPQGGRVRKGTLVVEAFSVHDSTIPDRYEEILHLSGEFKLDDGRSVRSEEGRWNE